MTIRDYFKARSRRARMVLGVGLLVVAVAAGLALTDYREYPHAVTGAALLGLAIVFCALLYLDLTKCPQCLQRLGIQIANQYRIGPRVNFCPFCGVRFDKCEIRNT